MKAKKILIFLGIIIIVIDAIVWGNSSHTTQLYMNTWLWWIDVIGGLLLCIGMYLHLKQRSYH